MATDFFSSNSNPYPYGYQKQYPTRVISGQDILELNGEQQQNLIGHTLSYCNELESALNEAVTRAESFHARLVELGDIIPPKTPEELLQEQAAAQQEVNATLLKTIQALSEKEELAQGQAAQQRETNAILLSTIQKLSDKIDRMEKEDNHAGLNTDSTNSSESVQPGTNSESRKRNK